MLNRFLDIDPGDAVPLWKQIEDGVAAHIASGALAPGAPVPSVRDLARDLRINPATVQKGYQRLVEAGFLAIRRGEGTFVSERPPTLGRAERSRRLEEAASRYAVTSTNLGASGAEAVAELRSALSRLGRHEQGGKP